MHCVYADYFLAISLPTVPGNSSKSPDPTETNKPQIRPTHYHGHAGYYPQHARYPPSPPTMLGTTPTMLGTTPTMPGTALTMLGTTLTTFQHVGTVPNPNRFDPLG